MKKFVVIGGLILASCAPQAEQPFSKANVATMEIGLTTGLRLANACLQARVGPCGDPVSRSRIISDEHKAVDAFDALRTANSANQPAALTAFNLILNTLVAEIPSAQK